MEDRFHRSFTEAELSAMPEMLARRIRREEIHFTPRQWRVLSLRLGLEDGHPKSPEEVAELLGITLERVRLTESMVLRRNPGHRPSKALRDFLK